LPLLGNYDGLHALRITYQEGSYLKEYLQEASSVLAEQRTDELKGLQVQEAQQRLAQYGPNKLAEAKKDPLWKRFFAQMADPMIIMLIVAAAISGAVGLPR
jgi:Ca2+-transporting ATPase